MFELDGEQFDLATITAWADDDNKTVEEYINAYGLTPVKKQRPRSLADVGTGSMQTSENQNGASDSVNILSGYKNVLEEAQAEADKLESEWLKQADAVENREWVIGTGAGLGMGLPITFKTANYSKFAKQAKEQAVEGEDWVALAKKMYVEERRQKFLQKKQEAFLDDLKDAETGIFSLHTIESLTPISAIEKLTGADILETGYEKKRKELSAALDNIKEESAQQVKYTEAKLPIVEKSLIEKSNRLNKILEDAKKNPQNITPEIQAEFNSLKESLIDEQSNYEDLIKNYFEAAKDANDYGTAANLASRSQAMTDIIPTTILATAYDILGGTTKVVSELSPLKIADKIGLLDETVPEEAKQILEYMPMPGVTSSQYASDFFAGQAEGIRGIIQSPKEFDSIDNASDFGQFLGELFSGQAVNTAITMVAPPIGLTVMGMSASGNKMREMDIEIEKGKKIAPWQYYSSAASYGLFESLTEKVAASKFLKGTKLLRGKLGLVDDFNLSPRLDINTMTWSKATANWALDVAEEGGTEWLAQLGQNATDKYILGEDVSLTQGLNAAFWSGAMMSGLGFNNPVLAGDFYRAAATTDEIKLSNKYGEEIQSRISELNRLFKMPKEQKTKETWDAIAVHREALDGIYRDIHAAMKKNAARLDNLGRQDKDRLLRYQAKQHNIKKQIADVLNNKELSKADKEAAVKKLQTNYDNINNSKDKILKEAAFSQDQKNINRKKFINLFKSGADSKLTYLLGDNKDDIKAKLQAALDANQKISEEERAFIQGEINRVGFDKNGKEVDFHGVSLGEGTSMPMVAVNSQTAPNLDAFVNSHEIGHQTLFRSLVNGNKYGLALVNEGIDYMSKRYKKVKAIADRVDFVYREAGFSEEIIAEEKLAAISSYMREIDISKDKTLQGKLLSLWENIKNKKYDNIENVNTGEDVFRLLQDYTNAFERGELAASTIALMKEESMPISGRAATYSLSEKDNAELAKIHEKGTDKIFRNPAAYKLIQSVANAITKKYFSPIPADARNGVTFDEYEMTAISELAIIAREWDQTKQDFGKFLSNRGFTRLSDLAKRLGIESTEEYGGIGIMADVETSKEAQSEFADEQTDAEVSAEAQVKDKLSFAEGLNIDTKVEDKSLKDHVTSALTKAAKLGITKFTEEVSKNRTITPFVASIKEDMSEGLRKVVKSFINNYGYDQFLIDYKDLILDNYTTTYLSKHPLFKKGIQKSINGVWVSPVEVSKDVYDFVDANGNKYPRGSFDRETAGVSGKTSGPELIRRNPDINNIIKTGEFVNYHFQDGAQRKKKKQNPEDALARQIGAELAFDILKEDLLTNGPISMEIGEVADLRGIVFNEAGIADVAKSIDRGTVKYSASLADVLVENSRGIVDIFEANSDQNTIISELSKLLNIDDKLSSDLYKLFKGAIERYFINVEKLKSTAQALKILNSNLFKNVAYEDGVAKIVRKPRIQWLFKGKRSQRAQRLIDTTVEDLSEQLKDQDSETQIKILTNFIHFDSRAYRQTKLLGNNQNLYADILSKLPINSDIKITKDKNIWGNTTILINGNVATLNDNFDISKKSVQNNIIENEVDYNEFSNRAAEYFINKLIRFSKLIDKNPAKLDDAFAWLSLQGSHSASALRLAANIIAHDPRYKSIETVFEHLTTVNTMGNISATFLMAPDVMPLEIVREAFKNYKVTIIAAEQNKKYKKAGLESTSGKNYQTDKVNWSRALEAGISQDYINSLESKNKYSLSTQDLKTFDNMVSAKTGIKGEVGEAIANRLGKNKGRFTFFIPPSADDFMGLMYYLIRSGTNGNIDIKFIKDKLIDPFANGIAALESYKQNKLTAFRNIKKSIKGNKNLKLNKENETGFTNEQSVRVYLWAKKGYDISNITAAEQKAIIKYVNETPALLDFANQMQNLFIPEDGYPAPQDNWFAGTMTTDILNHINDTSRAEFLKEYIENFEALFGKLGKNGEITGPIANKLRAAFGNNYVEALSDILYRMKNGRAREFGKNRLVNKFNNWISNAVGSIMFLNTRSALLQQVSLVNFINLSDNNPIAFAQAIANTEQYAADYLKLLNSDFLKQRRGGLSIDVNEDEIAKAAAAGGNSISNIIAVILKKGFVLTTWADSHAIASGGATFYRNRINTYIKQGMTIEEAEAKAFFEFKELAEESQQSSRPDKISQQQASSLGRIILAFANTPMQYARITKKAALDLINGRGDWKTNTSKLLYYGAMQNIMFTYMQQALFALAFGDDEEEDKKATDRYIYAANGMADGFLRGLGFGGAVAATAKNMVLEAIEQEQGRKDYDEVVWKALTLSPPLSSKIDKARSVARTFTWKQEREKIFTKGISFENPIFDATGKATSVITNIPLDRVIRKADNITMPLRQEIEFWQATALYLGYGKYELDLYEKPEDKKSKSNKRTKPNYSKPKYNRRKYGENK